MGMIISHPLRPARLLNYAYTSNPFRFFRACPLPPSLLAALCFACVDPFYSFFVLVFSSAVRLVDVVTINTPSCAVEIKHVN
jgi:hypothetical protein